MDLDFPDAKLKLSALPPIPGPARAKEASLQSGSSYEAHLHDRYVPTEMKNFSQVFRMGHALLIPRA